MDGLRRRGRSHSPYRSRPHYYKYCYSDNDTKPLIVRHNSEVALKDEDIDMDEVALG